MFSEGKDDSVVVVKDLEKTITAESHLASIVDMSTSGQNSGIWENQTPMIRITYEDLDLSGIEAAYRADEGFLPLRNFLVGKKKGVDKSKCAFGLHCVTSTAEETNNAVYILQIEKSLYDKVDEKDGSGVDVFGTIKIYGLAQEPVVLEIGESYKYRTFGLNREDTESTFWVTKEDLQNPEGKKVITIHFTVGLSCSPHWDHEFFNIGNAETKSILRKMYDLPDSSKDVTIVAANGAEVKAHKNILMAHSPVFCSMLNSENTMTEAQSGKIVMEENSEEGVTQLIRYLYGLNLVVDAVSPDLALEMFQLSHKYGLNKLEGNMKDLLTEKGMDWYTADSILELYYYVKNNEDFEEVIAHALTEMTDGLSDEDLMTSDYFKNLDEAGRLKLLCTLWNWSRIKI